MLNGPQRKWNKADLFTAEYSMNYKDKNKESRKQIFKDNTKSTVCLYLLEAASPSILLIDIHLVFRKTVDNMADKM